MTAVESTKERIQTNLTSLAEALPELTQCISLSMAWVQREWGIAAENPAKSLLVGAKVSILEAGTSYGLGLNRGAALSLRLYVENVFSWLYYKDHPVEYALVLRKKADLMLPKAVQAYLKNIDEGFDKSYSTLSKCKSREDEYYYTNVSDYIHAHPRFVSLEGPIEATAISVPRDASFLHLASKSDEFISDNLSSYYRKSWDDMPMIVKKSILTRMGGKLKDFI